MRMSYVCLLLTGFARLRGLPMQTKISSKQVVEKIGAANSENFNKRCRGRYSCAMAQLAVYRSIQAGPTTDVAKAI